MPAGPTAAVLDAWPVVERYAGYEPSTTAIESLLSTGDTPAVMSTVNFGEVYSSLLRDRGSEIAGRDAAWLRQLLVLEPVTVELAVAAARIKCAYHMSLGDSLAAATAMVHEAPLWTGDAELLCEDRTWQVVDLRDDDRRRQHSEGIAAGRLRVGRRASALPGLQRRQLADYIVSPPVVPTTPATEPPVKI